jgi:TonB family protein
MLLFLSWPESQKNYPTRGQIPISVLPALEPKREVNNRTASPASESRNSRVKGPGSITQNVPPPPPKELAKPSTRLYESPVEKPTPERQKEISIARRPLPTLKELLPPAAWSAKGERSSAREDPVRLDTREPRYVPYFESIKRSIENVWEYPEPALRRGLQGKLVIEFTVLENGALEGTQMIRSSGFPELDQEALRAVRAASPFLPIPPSIGRNRIDIVASFEYHDNRLRYDFSR